MSDDAGTGAQVPSPPATCGTAVRGRRSRPAPSEPTRSDSPPQADEGRGDSVTPRSSSKSDRKVALLRRTIFALCRQYDIGDALRHELQLSVTGKRSLTKMTVTEMQRVIDRIAGKNVWTPRGMMNKLAGELDNGPARLRAYCWKRFSKEPDQLTAREIRACIACLKNWKKKESG